MNNSEYLLEVRNLKKHFPIKKGALRRVVGHVKAVDDISFKIKKGKTLGLVGESGCGKTTAGRTILKLHDPTSGETIFNGENVYEKSRGELKNLRTKMQIIFQDPYSSLNPRLPVFELVGEALREHKIVRNNREMQEKVIEIITKCGLTKEQATRYPHQFSGGQRQRIGISRALALNPEFVVCDEAVSALDVSIQSQIINLLKDMQDEMGLSYLFISHDLTVIKLISDDVGVMYLGQLVEMGSKQQIFTNPRHPYTRVLLEAAPHYDPRNRANRKRTLLEGDIPSPANPPSGCRFHTRCIHAKDICKEAVPENKEIDTGHFAMCHKVNDLF
ncbi:MAG: ATP-binding cassette domain-containing protein [Defluviitaleaceae bacterium]|nr:ATP-binding cassette domain-containing protein [Defluviitaleaceae bacterium]MCL2836306.1 ATP-binding cassette domain-containing protein [Defluviitaleaceae bacterium]